MDPRARTRVSVRLRERTNRIAAAALHAGLQVVSELNIRQLADALRCFPSSVHVWIRTPPRTTRPYREKAQRTARAIRTLHAAGAFARNVGLVDGYMHLEGETPLGGVHYHRQSGLHERAWRQIVPPGMMPWPVRITEPEPA